MKIEVKKVTDIDLLQRAAWFTSGVENFKAPLSKWYDAEHSPIRTQMFVVEMFDIPSFVSTHYVRHKLGVEHFVRTNREDRKGDKKANRLTPVMHMMFLNSQTLIYMARKRLCFKASKETRDAMVMIKDGVRPHDEALSNAMVPECEYRGRCTEFKSCGYFEGKANDNK